MKKFKFSRRSLRLAALLVSLALPAAAQRPLRAKVALLGVEGPSDLMQSINTFVEGFLSALTDFGNFQVLPQAAANKLYHEKRFKTPYTYVKMSSFGKLAKVEKVFAGRVFSQGEAGWTLKMDCVDVATGRKEFSLQSRCPHCSDDNIGVSKMQGGQLGHDVTYWYQKREKKQPRPAKSQSKPKPKPEPQD